MHNLFNELYWEERWALQNYNFEFPVVGLVDYNRVLQLAGFQEATRAGFAAGEQRRLASKVIPWPIVDEEGNRYALNPDGGLFGQIEVVAGNPGSNSEVKWYGKESITWVPVSPKTSPTRFLSIARPHTLVLVDFPFLYPKLQNFRSSGECDDDRDGFVRTWAINQIEIRHPLMYQALVTEGLAYSAGNPLVYGERVVSPGLFEGRCR